MSEDIKEDAVVIGVGFTYINGKQILDFDVDEIVITDGSMGSRIISDGEIKIDAVECDNVVEKLREMRADA